MTQSDDTILSKKAVAVIILPSVHQNRSPVRELFPLSGYVRVDSVLRFFHNTLGKQIGHMVITTGHSEYILYDAI